jgi:hypothetical protein
VQSFPAGLEHRDTGVIAAGLYGRQQATVAGGGRGEGGGGPSLDELTLEYAPPEVIISSRCAAGFVDFDQLHGWLNTLC